jgi:hypothetical protein
MKQTTEQKIAAIEGRLARLRNSRRLEQRRLQNDRRRADAHRKIELGGLLIVAGVDDWDAATLVGGLLALSRAKSENLAAFREQGIKHMETRKTGR